VYNFYVQTFLEYLFSKIVVREVLNKLLGITYPYNFFKNLLMINFFNDNLSSQVRMRLVPTKFTGKIIIEISPHNFSNLTFINNLYK
jgi:hypothetical protein